MKSDLTKRLDDVERQVVPPRRMVVLWGNAPEPADLVDGLDVVSVLRVQWRREPAVTP